MPTPNFAKAVAGSMTGLDDAPSPSYILSIATAQVSRESHVVRLTESGDSSAVFGASKRFVYRVQEGFAWLQDGSGNYIHLTENMASVSGALYGRVSQAILQRSFPEEALVDVTAAQDPAPITVFDTGIPDFAGSVRGFLQNDEELFEGDHNETPATLILPLGGSKTVQGTAILAQIGASPSFRGGAAIETDYRFVLSGDVTHAGTPFKDERFSVSLDLNTGKIMSGTMILTRLRVDLDYSTALHVPVRFEGIFTGAVGFAE